MTDRDALAREMYQTAYKHAKELDPKTPIGLLLYHCADMALRQSEIARAEERERLAVSVSALKVPRVDDLAEGYNVGLRKAVHLIRAGSPSPAYQDMSDAIADLTLEDAYAVFPLARPPAPAAPVVWTDAQVDAALVAWYQNDPKWFEVDEKFRDDMRKDMRAALEAASREGE